MSFTEADIEDLTRLLEGRPEWCARIRLLLLSGEASDSHEDRAATRSDTDRRLDRMAATLDRSSQEFDRRIADLTARMDRYAEERVEADRRTDQRFAELAARLDGYAEERVEADRRTDQRFAELAACLDGYAEERAEANRLIDQRFDRYAEERAEADRRTDQRFAEIGKRIDQLAETTKTHADDIGTLKGWNLEDRFRQRPSAYLRSFFLRTRACTRSELDELLDAGVERGIISEDDWEDVRLADVVVRGQRRDDGTDVFLVVEVSWGVGLGDLERAVRRAGILGRLVAPVLPVVAGNGVTAEASSRCDAEGVWLVLKGRVVAPNGTAAGD